MVEEMINSPLTEGIWPGVSDGIYHADPCPEPSLSSGIARLLLSRSPMHAWHAHPRLNPNHEPRAGNKAMDAGSMIHKILLGVGQDIEVIEVPYGPKHAKAGQLVTDYKTDAAQAARDAVIARGAIPVFAGDLAEIHEAAAAIRKGIEATVEGAMLFEPGIPEATLIWREGSIWCRARADYLLNDPFMPILDLKTTKLSANPEEWQRKLAADYCFQDAFYRRGLTALRQETPPMRFIVGEQEKPHGVAVCCAAPSLAAYAEDGVERAIRMWGKCLASGNWPGYSPQTAHVECPPWLLNRMEEQSMREELESET